MLNCLGLVRSLRRFGLFLFRLLLVFLVVLFLVLLFGGGLGLDGVEVGFLLLVVGQIVLVLRPAVGVCLGRAVDRGDSPPLVRLPRSDRRIATGSFTGRK